MGISDWLRALGPKLQQDHLWQRIVKHTTAITITTIVVIIPAIRHIFGTASYLACMTAVFGDCARRFGQMAESLVLITAGMLLGLGWSILGLYLSSLVFETHEPAAYTIRALFLVIGTIVHGYVRSKSPRLFVLVFLFLLTSLQNLVGTASRVTVATATQTLYPILTAMGVLLLVNVAVFPEFSGGFLADTTIQTLSQTQTTLKSATEWFMEPTSLTAQETHADAGPNEGNLGKSRSKSGASAKSTTTSTQRSKLAILGGAKAKLRAKLKNCKSALKECMFEIEYAVIPSRSLKPISSTSMTGLIRNVTTLISACESKFVMMDGPKTVSDSSDSDEAHSLPTSHTEDRGTSPRRPSQSVPISRRTSMESRLEHVKPQREIASGDPEVLDALLARVRQPVKELLEDIDGALSLATTCIAYCYDVAKLPAGIVAPKDLSLEEVDVRVDIFTNATVSFDRCFQEALSKVAAAESENGDVDIMPRIETFLLSSSLLSLRHAAEHVAQMLKHARVLVARRQNRNNRRRLYWPRKINWRRWLRSGGEQDVMALPENARKEVRRGDDKPKLDPKLDHKKQTKNEEDEDDTDSEDEKPSSPQKRDEEANLPTTSIRIEEPPGKAKSDPRSPYTPKPAPPKLTSLFWWRNQFADLTEAVLHSEHLAYALKLTIAMFSVTWIPFYGPFNPWFASIRGLWAPLQLVLVFEVAIGSSLWIFFVRAGGVIFGCVWGYAAYEISRGQLVALVVILVPGIVISSYVQIGTPYVKAGMISIVSMCIVALATVGGTGAAWENFVKRLVAFLIGGTVALMVEVLLYPVRARDRLIESLSTTINHIARMEGAIATGAESSVRVTSLQTSGIHARFQKAKAKAQASLSAAETFLPFCLSEPRLKGSFRTLEPVYKEIIYVLHQIIDRMDNAISLRQAYGSSVLEDMNPEVHMHRRNVAAAINLTLFAVNEALTTKLPLPQFLPSCRLAQMRLVNRVREVMKTEQPSIIGQVLSSTSLMTRVRQKRRQQFHSHNRRSSRPTSSGYDSGYNTPRPDKSTTRLATQQKFLSWSAAAAGQMEIIEFLEELVDLAKILVGVNAFRSGMLDRPSYRGYVSRLRALEQTQSSTSGPPGSDGRARSLTPTHDHNDDEQQHGGLVSLVASAPTVLSRRWTGGGNSSSVTGGVPLGKKESLTERFKRKVMSNPDHGVGEEGKQEENVLPVSLQRVGSRFGKKASLARE